MEEKNNKGYFPFTYYEDFLKFLDARSSCIEVITYDDLCWDDDYNFKGNYPKEWHCWKSKLKNGELDKEKIYVLLQHDVDVSPYLTQNMISTELQYGIRSNIMMFNRRVKRKHFQRTGELLFDDDGYSIDIKRWLDFQKQGVVFCYHSNPFEQSEFNIEKALDIFEADVVALREKFKINYFSPHGGARSPNGDSNNTLTIPDALKKNIRWVANGHTVRFDGVFSDGGPNSPKRNPNKRDLKDFVATWKPGGRYRVLTHPQYYCDPCGISERLNEAAWYRKMQDIYSCGSLNYWADACMSGGKGDTGGVCNLNNEDSQRFEKEEKMSYLSDFSNKILQKLKRG